MIRSTSLEARNRIRPCAPEQREKILDALRHGPLHDEELCTVTGLSPSSLRPRRGELLRDGVIRLHPGTRKTRSGRAAQLWSVA